MTTVTRHDFYIRQGSNFNEVVRWQVPPIVYKAISGITQAAPAVVTAPSHGLPDGWQAYIVSVKGMRDINDPDTPRIATVVDASNVAFNDINSSEFKAYVSGGYLKYYTPASLAGFTARMSIKNKVGGSELLRLDTTAGGIALDDAKKTITLSASATATAALAWTRGVYDLELVSAGGVVTPLLSGYVYVTKEVTST